jgi:predicted nucleic acid-binding protein
VIVLDASVVVEWLLQTPAGQRVEKRIYSRKESLHAPELLDLEVAQVLRRFAREGRISNSRAEEALEDLIDLRTTRYPHSALLPRIWQLRHDLSAYDAAYIVLAERLAAILLTCDARLASAPGHSAAVEVI